MTIKIRPLIFKESGRIILARYKADGTLAMEAEDMIIGNGTVQSIVPSVNFSTTEMEDGNSMFPMGVYDTGIAATVQVTMASFVPKLYAALVGDPAQVVENDTLWEADGEYTIPDTAPYEVKLANTPKTEGKLFVSGDDGTLYEKNGSPAAGKYSLTGDTLTFHEDDAGKTIYVTYEYTHDALGFGLRTKGSRPVYHAIISGVATDIDEIAEYPVNLIFDKCKGADDISEPPRQSTPEAWSYSLRILKPRPGRKAVDWKYTISDTGGSPA